jgi:hypothetical protein
VAISYQFIRLNLHATMGWDKEDQTGVNPPRKSGKGGGPPAQAKPGSGDPIDNIFHDHEDGNEDSDDKNTDYNFGMDGGPTASTTGTTVNPGDIVLRVRQ